eukprot:498393-Prorocentrum_lima.AAC.1
MQAGLPMALGGCGLKPLAEYGLPGRLAALPLMGTDLIRREQLDPGFGPTARKGLEQLRQEFTRLDQDFATK